MKRLIAISALVLLMAGVVAHAADNDEALKAVALVKKAVVFYKANDMEKALDEINNPKGQLNSGELYVFAYDQKATLLANSKATALLGKNLMDVPDADGKMFRKEIVTTTTTKGSGWIDYKYKNPKTKEIESKTTYCEKVDELILCCGIYKK